MTRGESKFIKNRDEFQTTENGCMVENFISLYFSQLHQQRAK